MHPSNLKSMIQMSEAKDKTVEAWSSRWENRAIQLVAINLIQWKDKADLFDVTMKRKRRYKHTNIRNKESRTCYHNVIKKIRVSW